MRKWKHETIDAPTGGALDSIELTLRFITPVFGGGVDAKQADVVTPVRGAAIRGQLRFWWRATSSLKETWKLRDKEVELFGGVHGGGPVASKLELAVTRQPGAPRELRVYEDNNPFRKERGIGPGLAYGAFPLRASERPLIHDKLFCYRDDFDVVLRFPKNGVRGDIERALRAFLHLGGIGGRTRRGFGAVELVEARGFTLEPLSQDLCGKEAAPWPTLAGFAESRSQGSASWPKMPAHEAHEKGLAILWGMRQRPGEGRNHGQGNRPGRSLWPEADAIRAIYKGQVRGPHTQRLIHVDKFPRAAFGAPIIFHFKDRGDPRDTTLLPEGKSRLASPLLIRPHRCDRGYSVLAARIEEPVDRWELREGKRHKATVNVRLTGSEPKQIKPLGDAADPIAAYFQRLAAL